MRRSATGSSLPDAERQSKSTPFGQRASSDGKLDPATFGETEAAQYADLASSCYDSFNKRFWYDAGGYLILLRHEQRQDFPPVFYLQSEFLETVFGEAFSRFINNFRFFFLDMADHFIHHTGHLCLETPVRRIHTVQLLKQLFDRAMIFYRRRDEARGGG